MRPMPGMIGLVSSNSKVHNVYNLVSVGHVANMLVIETLSFAFACMMFLASLEVLF